MLETKSGGRRAASGVSGLDEVRPTGIVPANLSLALIVCSSPISQIVVSRIVERTGLKTICDHPRHAGRLLTERSPGVMVVDCGPRNDECHALAPSIVTQRQLAGAHLPLLVALAAGELPPRSPFATIADAVVQKPITPEGLQPTIERLLDRART